MTSALTGVKQAEAVQRAGRGWAVGTPPAKEVSKGLTELLERMTVLAA